MHLIASKKSSDNRKLADAIKWPYETHYFYNKETLDLYTKSNKNGKTIFDHCYDHPQDSTMMAIFGEFLSHFENTVFGEEFIENGRDEIVKKLEIARPSPSITKVMDHYNAQYAKCQKLTKKSEDREIAW